jgi:hypothetical protein
LPETGARKTNTRNDTRKGDTGLLTDTLVRELIAKRKYKPNAKKVNTSLFTAA